MVPGGIGLLAVKFICFGKLQNQGIPSSLWHDFRGRQDEDSWVVDKVKRRSRTDERINLKSHSFRRLGHTLRMGEETNLFGFYEATIRKKAGGFIRTSVNRQYRPRYSILGF